MSKLSKVHRRPTQDEIPTRRQHIFEPDGRPHGTAVQHRLRAEAQLRAERKAEAQSSVLKTAQKPAGYDNNSHHAVNFYRKSLWETSIS